MNRKAFLNSFIRRISIKDSEAEIEYTCPIGLGGNRRNEVLSMERIGSRGRARRCYRSIILSLQHVFTTSCVTFQAVSVTCRTVSFTLSF